MDELIELLAAALMIAGPDGKEPSHKPASMEDAELHAFSAIDAAAWFGREEITPELLVSMAAFESDYRSRVVSREVCKGGRCKRKTGLWEHDWKPPGHKKGSTFFCGTLQVTAKKWSECLTYNLDVEATYFVAAQELVEWLDSKKCKKRKGKSKLRCALLGYGGGHPLIRKWNHRYPTRIMKRMAEIEERQEFLSLAWYNGQEEPW